MRWELVRPWVNRVGIVLEFLSFWFAAPEILGEEPMKATCCDRAWFTKQGGGE